LIRFPAFKKAKQQLLYTEKCWRLQAGVAKQEAAVKTVHNSHIAIA